VCREQFKRRAMTRRDSRCTWCKRRISAHKATSMIDLLGVENSNNENSNGDA
jgi:hypothetical protein